MVAVIRWLGVVMGVVMTVVLVRLASRAPAAERARGLHRTRPRVPEPIRTRLAASLARADLALEPEDAVTRIAVASAAVGVLVLPIAAALAVPAVLGTLCAGPIGLLLARDRADRRGAAAIPPALDRVSAVLRAGGTVSEAVSGLAAAGGPLSGDLRRVHARAEMGAGLVDALSLWPTERPIPGVRAAAGALALAAELGGGCADALEGLGASLRARDGAVREALALSAQARVSAVVVGLAPLGYLLLAAVVDPAALGALLGTGVGRVCLVFGLMLDAAGAAWMRAMVRAEA